MNDCINIFYNYFIIIIAAAQSRLEAASLRVANARQPWYSPPTQPLIFLIFQMIFILISGVDNVQEVATFVQQSARTKRVSKYNNVIYTINNYVHTLNCLLFRHAYEEFRRELVQCLPLNNKR